MRTNAPFALTVAVLLIGYAAQSATYLNHDVAWVLYSSRLMFHGARFGTDIIAANPPLIWWISTIPNAAAELFGLPVIATFRIFVLLLAATSLFVANRFLIAKKASASTRLLFLATGAYLLTIGVHRDYGQREHLTVMLVLPYILAVAHRMDGRQLSTIAGFAIGVAAGIGTAFKPHFLLAPLLLETVLAWRTRSLRTVIRPETLGAAAAVTLYAAAVLIFTRPWLFGALPDIARVYWAFEEPAPVLIPIAIRFFIPLCATLLVLRFNPSSQSEVLVLAALGFFGAALLQGKYYTYHIYPAYTLLLLAFMIGIASMRKAWRFPAIALAAFAVFLNLQDTVGSLINRSDRGALGKNIADAVAFVDQHSAADGSFLAISTHPYPGFPTALYAQRRWASPSNSAIFLPAVVHLREAGHLADRELLGFAERKAREAMMRDLATAPDVVLVDLRDVRHAIGRSKFDYLQFFMEDPAFRTAWADYEPATSSPTGFAAYVRKRGGRS